MSELDLVLFGATGYVGELVARHLAEVAPASARIGLAGRSKERLERVRDDLGRDWPLLVVEADDPEELVSTARVVCTTVGPYSRYGWPLVEACARSGSHYLDLTGEMLFHRRVIDELHEVAQASGTRIVPSCGYDSIPSDLGVHLLAGRARTDGAGQLAQTTLIATMKGGVSGGTVDSLRAQVEQVTREPELAPIVLDPYALSPDREAEPDLGAEKDPRTVSREDGRWLGPFVMAPYNTRVVRRSNALTGWSYGRTLKYTERMSFGTSPIAPLLAAGSVATLTLAPAAMGFAPTRRVLDRFLPQPGQGPSAAAREAGWFRMEVDAVTTMGARYRAVVAGPGDPGYAATAVMMGQSALALAFDELPERSGVLTPATAMGDALSARLRAQGLTVSVEAC